MIDVVTCFEIVPVGNGTHYLCRDYTGSHFERHKSSSDRSDMLLFESELLAQAYIDKYLDRHKYIPEYIIFNTKYLPKTIIRQIEPEN